MRRIATVPSAAAVLTLGLAAPAQALQPGLGARHRQTIIIRVMHRDEVGGADLRRPEDEARRGVRSGVWPTYHRGNMDRYERANRATASWEYVGLLYNGYGEYVVDHRAPPRGP